MFTVQVAKEIIVKVEFIYVWLLFGIWVTLLWGLSILEFAVLQDTFF